MVQGPIVPRVQGTRVYTLAKEGWNLTHKDCGHNEHALLVRVAIV